MPVPGAGAPTSWVLLASELGQQSEDLASLRLAIADLEGASDTNRCARVRVGVAVNPSSGWMRATVALVVHALDL